MNREAKLFLDGLCELRRGQRSIGCLDSADELHDLGSQLVAAARSALFWKQARQAGLLKRGPGLIERRPGESKGFRRRTDGLLVDSDLTEHLVLDLDQVLRVEEIAVLKQLVLYILRARVENPLLAERLAFEGLA